ncbi:hypothetical protein H4696_000995 [Amycolatopsis lexingtonensis]|uniref:Uncharacterized protein n=1 Tax=Amycolatopsis lexingtonensis TaxID=218822 RepID=A0ABR9HSI8_9PSEU|nr:hypothetical protein [Amycolatopsis lexingtonensis]MBE1493895.1 hypothetical protein [Amycolatopsis lexingtonensis]
MSGIHRAGGLSLDFARFRLDDERVHAAVTVNATAAPSHLSLFRTDPPETEWVSVQLEVPGLTR